MRRAGRHEACQRAAPPSRATILFGEEFLYELKAGATVTGEPTAPWLEALPTLVLQPLIVISRVSVLDAGAVMPVGPRGGR
jgi:hypothetical protein